MGMLIFIAWYAGAPFVLAALAYIADRIAGTE